MGSGFAPRWQGGVGLLRWLRNPHLYALLRSWKCFFALASAYIVVGQDDPKPNQYAD